MSQKSEKKYCKSGDGIVHAVSAYADEFTVCGDAHDGLDEDAEGSGWVDCKRGPVTCKRCCQVIEGVRGMRLAPPEKRRGIEN